MNRILKIIISCGLSFLFLSTVFHVDYHYQDHHDGYSICDIGCDDKKHHSISHQCEKCLNKNNKQIVQEFIDLSYNKYNRALYSSTENFNKTFTIFSLYSRPPPSLL